MTESFVLFRQGKNVIGPFASFVDAAEHMIDEKLLGYAVLPMVEPKTKEPEKTKVTISIDPGSGTGGSPVVIPRHHPQHPRLSPRADRARTELKRAVESFSWDSGYEVDTNLREFMRLVRNTCPSAPDFTINVIKELRQLAFDHGMQLGLKPARDLVDEYLKRGEQRG